MASKLQLIALWFYVTLLFIGGLMGFIKAGSKISLITSSISALLVALCALGILKPFWIADIVVGLLAVFFAMRFFKGKKFMPAGLTMVCSVIVLGILLFAPA
jgi:uncharacterized membrane protein (UPF0136 family)